MVQQKPNESKKSVKTETPAQKNPVTSKSSLMEKKPTLNSKKANFKKIHTERKLPSINKNDKNRRNKDVNVLNSFNPEDIQKTKQTRKFEYSSPKISQDISPPNPKIQISTHNKIRDKEQFEDLEYNPRKTENRKKRSQNLESTDKDISNQNNDQHAVKFTVKKSIPSKHTTKQKIDLKTATGDRIKGLANKKGFSVSIKPLNKSFAIRTDQIKPNICVNISYKKIQSQLETSTQTKLDNRQTDFEKLHSSYHEEMVGGCISSMVNLEQTITKECISYKTDNIVTKKTTSTRKDSITEKHPQRLHYKDFEKREITKSTVSSRPDNSSTNDQIKPHVFGLKKSSNNTAAIESRNSIYQNTVQKTLKTAGKFSKKSISSHLEQLSITVEKQPMITYPIKINSYSNNQNLLKNNVIENEKLRTYRKGGITNSRSKQSMVFDSPEVVSSIWTTENTNTQVSYTTSSNLLRNPSSKVQTAPQYTIIQKFRKLTQNLPTNSVTHFGPHFHGTKTENLRFMDYQLGALSPFCSEYDSIYLEPVKHSNNTISAPTQSKIAESCTQRKNRRNKCKKN